MNYAELFMSIRNLIPKESFCIEADTWRYEFSDRGQTVVEWKVWLSADTKYAEGKTAEEALQRAREIVAARPPKEPTPPEGIPEAVKEIGLVPLAIDPETV